MNTPSRLRPLACILLGVLLWLASVTGAPATHGGEAGISQASAATLALPSAAVRLGKVASASSAQVARGIGQWLVPIAAHTATPLRYICCSTTPPAGNGRASREVLALTFPYDATAPPSLRV